MKNYPVTVGIIRIPDLTNEDSSSMSAKGFGREAHLRLKMVVIPRFERINYITQEIYSVSH